jgi:hypothetical protein
MAGFRAFLTGTGQSALGRIVLKNAAGTFGGKYS